MKRRVRKIANFFAFNLLFFALYLNFIHKDKANLPDVAAKQNAFSGAVMVDAGSSKNASTVTVQPAIKEEENDAVALKLSIN